MYQILCEIRNAKTKTFLGSMVLEEYTREAIATYEVAGAHDNQRLTNKIAPLVIALRELHPNVKVFSFTYKIQIALSFEHEAECDIISIPQ